MSLWLRDQIRIVLCPYQLTAVRLRFGFRPRIVAKEIMPVTGAGAGAAAEPSMPVLEALSELLKKPAWQKANTVIILSNQFMRYQLLPASSARLNESEQLARARHVVAQIYGERSSTLTLKIDGSPIGSAVLVAGTETAFIEALKKLIDSSTVKLISIQPYLMSLFNEYRHRISEEPQWFVVQEEGMLCAALLHRGRWEQVRMQKTTQDWQPALQRILSRAQVTSALAEKAKKISLWIHNGDVPPLTHSDDWSFHLLKPSPVAGFSPLRDAAYSGALAGIR